MSASLPLLYLSILWAFAGTIDRVVASVGGQLVTESDVALERELAQIDLQSGPFWDPIHTDPLQRLMDAALVRLLAGDVSLYAPPEAQLNARLEALRRTVGDRDRWEAFLRRHGLDEDGVRTLLRRRLVVHRYLERNLALQTSSSAESMQKCDMWLTEQRPRYRIRVIPPETP